jgi:hypothetical protein
MYPATTHPDTDFLVFLDAPTGVLIGSVDSLKINTYIINTI